MDMDTELLQKLSFKEHLNNIKKILQVVYRMDKTYFLTSCIVHIINAAVPYIGLMLSAYVLDALSAQKEFAEIFRTALFCCIAVFLLHFAASTVWNRLEVRRENMYYIYDCITQEKMLGMDYSRIDSPEVKDLKERARRDNNWGSGINSIFWQMNGLLYQGFTLIGAVVLGIPVISAMIGSGNYGLLLLLAGLLLVIVICMRCRVHFQKKADYYCYHILTGEEKKEQMHYCWDFACGSGYNYKNGKDVRIYGSYKLMKRWTTDVLYHPAYRKSMLEGAKGQAGSSAFYMLINGAVEGVSYLAVAVLALAGALSLGSVVKLAGCLRNFLSGLTAIANDLTELAMTARKQVSTIELLELENEMYKGRLPVEKRSDNEYQIEFRNVSFRYPGSSQYALKNFSMKLKIGEKLAIVGMNGSGKTTMIKLLCRLYDPDEGEILLNGVDIRKFKQEEYSRLFSVVFQDYTLFSLPLAQDVAVDVEYDEAKVRKCLEDAGFGSRLAQLKDGLETYLYTDYDDSGIQISGGEAQKIALARAVYKGAPFILLDEPTAALDPISEYEVYTNFDKIVGSKTAIYISHRLSSCRFCEKIAVFHEGSLVQYGSHEELAADTAGKYYEMWNAQAQYYKEQGMEEVLA